MKIPVNRLLQAPHPIGRVPEPGTPARTEGTPGGAQRVVDLHDKDTPEDDQQTDSASEVDTAPYGTVSVPQKRGLFQACVDIQSDVCEVPLKLVVRRFTPIPHKDSIHRSWVDHKTGVKKFKPTTPYAIVNMKNAVWEMRAY
ncbi:hypothetical protein C8A05DRAFT_36833, partial [Staphylotrichum tortipilum]